MEIFSHVQLHSIYPILQVGLPLLCLQLTYDRNQALLKDLLSDSMKYFYLHLVMQRSCWRSSGTCCMPFHSFLDENLTVLLGSRGA